MANYTNHHDNGYGFLQWNPFSDYMQTPTGRVEVEKVSKIHFSVTQSLQKYWTMILNSAKLILKGFEKNI
jgi:ABC-type uncharacterized transport system permease subunit